MAAFQAGWRLEYLAFSQWQAMKVTDIYPETGKGPGEIESPTHDLSRWQDGALILLDDSNGIAELI